VIGDVKQWTHVQITGQATEPLDVFARMHPDRILSRLICPRVLEADTSYIACIVPTYQVGVDAGLGREVAANATLDPAWTAAMTSIELPVYFHWEFATGGTGDFKSLVTRLQAQGELPGVGTRTLDVTTPGFGLEPRSATAIVPLGGALRVTAPAAPPVHELLADDLVDALGEDGVTPPMYGRWHAGAVVTARSNGTPGWLEGLNLDPRYRVAAGLGTKVVQDRQEDLMAAVWEQFGELERANQLLRHAQLAVAASERVVARHFAPLPDADLLLLAGPAFGRILVSQRRTARRVVVGSCAPIVAFSGAFRRIMRTRGPLGRRCTRLATPGFSDLMHPPAARPASLIDGLAAGRWNLPRPSHPDGAIATPAGLFTLRSREPLHPGRPATPVLDGQRLRPLRDLQAVFSRLAKRDADAGCTPLDVAALATSVRDALTPDVSIPPRVRAQIALPNHPRVFASNRLDPVMAAPVIPTPMIGPLLEFGQDWLLPGLVDVPPNTVTIVEPETSFIEAYMVGLNHEMGRELLWRGFPTDQRGTVFARFWDRRGTVASPTSPVPERDIPDIAAWDAKLPLGRHMMQAGAGIVLLIRGDLLQRYPRPTVFLQRARWNRDPQTGAIEYDGIIAKREPVPLPNDAAWAAHVHFPTFIGRASVDIGYFGFPVGRVEVCGADRTDLPATAKDHQAGWFVVFQEQPTEPRFGFPGSTATLPPGAAHAESIAASLIRPAFRLFVHASDLVTA